MVIQEIITHLESFAPLAYQESYDNSGLLVGHPLQQINKALLTIDVTEAVIDEAIEHGCGLIIAHHPIIFKGMKRLNGYNEVERCLIKAIKNDIAIYAAHTNLDSVTGGVNSKIAEKLKLTNCGILSPAKEQLFKLVTFVPTESAEQVRRAMFDAGAGHIGHYDRCSYNGNGTGTFRANDGTHPFVGNIGQEHHEKETRIETILPRHLKNKVVKALQNAHPYEEVAYDIYPLANEMPHVGIGMVGELAQPADEKEFLAVIKKLFNCQVIKYTNLLGKKIQKVAVCGGSGSFLLADAIRAGADIFITGDFKYHNYFDAEGKILIADIGHFESEQFTKELFYEIVIKKFPTFALRLSDVKTNPIFYFC